MKAGNGNHFEQAYKAQAAVDTETLWIVGPLVTDAPNDKQQLHSVLASIPDEVAQPGNVRVDTGYSSEKAIEKAEANGGPVVYCAQGKSGHPVSVADLEKHAETEPPPSGASLKGPMTYRLQTSQGKVLYKQRKQPVEPVFGGIQEVLGFRRFSLRGKEKAETEWGLVCLSYNLKKLFTRMGACAPKSSKRAFNGYWRVVSLRFRAKLDAFSLKVRWACCCLISFRWKIDCIEP